VRGMPGGGTEVVEQAGRTDACITDAQAVALAALGRRVEAHFGTPQDIEWALDAAGTLWLTQARPITSLYPVPPSRDGALRAFVCASLAQGLTRPITPMGLAAFGVLGGTAGRLVGLPGPHTSDPVAPPPAFAPVGGRAYTCARSALSEAWGRPAVDAGAGGSIPFVTAYAGLFPDAEILITGVEDPGTRAHGSNESLHLATFERACLAEALLLRNLAG